MISELWTREADLLALGAVNVLFDRQRHLIVLPYSLPLLHACAQALGIRRHWFHKDHYDIPKRMMLAFEYAAFADGFFQRVPSRVILSVARPR